MTKIVGISGSLRKGSFNSALLRAAIELQPPNLTIEIGSIEGIPLYNGDDEERSGIPPAVAALKEQIVAADGLLLVTPEYNNSIPGVFKNAIDWLSRPPADAPRIFRQRPLAVIGASPGAFGTILSQSAWSPVLRTLGTRPWFGSILYVSSAGKAFDASGKLIDQATRDRLQKFLVGFAEFIEK
jgi:NAD(P)H-dependent FMN reductase